MSILDKLRLRLGNIKQSLPFVRLFGYEKTYGRERSQNYDLMVENYKSWVYACVQRNAFSVAKCNLKAYKKGKVDGKEELQEIDEHPFLDLMSSVNPFFNKFELWVLTTTFLGLTGNAYWWLVLDKFGIPRQIWSLPANWVKIIPSKTEFIAGYALYVPGVATPIPFSEDEVIHFKYPSPFDMYYGTGPTLGAQYGVDLNNELKLHGINFLKNNAQPSGALYTPDGLNDEQFKRLKMQWNKEHRGSKNSGKMAILEQGLKYQQIGQGLSELKFEDIAKSVRDEILAIFGVPASKLGLVEDVNRANAEANDYTYQKETIEPRLTLIEEKLNEKLMPRYDVGLIAKFTSPVPADKEFRLRQTTEHIKSGYSSIDDERMKDNEEPYDTPETQKPLIPFSVIPAGEEREDPSKPIEDDDDDKDDKKIMTKATKRKRQHKWEMFASMVIPQENLFKKVMERYFKAQHSEVMHNVNNYRSISKDVKVGMIGNIIFNAQEETNKLKEISTPNIREAFLSGGGLAAEELGIDFSLIEPRVVRAIEGRINFFAGKINEGTIKLLTDELQDAVTAGENIEDIARRVDKVFNYCEKYRSVRVARTEVVGAANEGQLEVYKDAGIESKQWITARDEKVRGYHQIDGQTVGTTEDFKTKLGSHLQYPGDRSSGAPPEDLINCRCTHIAVVKQKE